jgi:cytoskeleton protein RodZ
MSEEKDTKKKKKTVEEPVQLQRTEYTRVGDVLRDARETKGLTIEEAAASINLRAGQIRAIEEGNFDQLPGTAYATGFIRSYAGFLKLDAMEMVKRFKAENAGIAGTRPELHFPEPIPEGNAPSAQTIGLAAGVVMVLLLGWIFFSGGGDVSTETPAPPVVAETTSVTSLLDAAPAATTTETVTALPADAAKATTPPAPAVDAAVPVATVPPADAAAIAAAPVAATAEAPKAPESPAVIEEKKPEEPITIAPVKSRITMKAKQSTWVQINSGSKILVKKVLKPGEQISVPDAPNLSLMTSNAGGVDVFVDGKRADALGRPGDIVRGLPLDADDLKKRRFRVRDY